jgi:desulfoferrodoxin (superoxide reductase-like protein)
MQVEGEVPKAVHIEMPTHNEPLPYPMAAARHIRAQLLSEQKEEVERKVKAQELNISNEELNHEATNESEVTKEGILAMFALCNVVELHSEAS